MKRKGTDMKNAYKALLIGVAMLGVVYAGTKAGATREEKNKVRVRRAMEAINKGNWESMRELYSPKFVQHSAGSEKPMGWEDYELGCRIVQRKLPDLRLRIEDIIAEGDKVAVRMRSSIQNKRWFSKQSNPEGVIELTEIDIIRIENGRIVEEWTEFDTAQALQLEMAMRYLGQAR